MRQYVVSIDNDAALVNVNEYYINRFCHTLAKAGINFRVWKGTHTYIPRKGYKYISTARRERFMELQSSSIKAGIPPMGWRLRITTTPDGYMRTLEYASAAPPRGSYRDLSSQGEAIIPILVRGGSYTSPPRGRVTA